MSRLLNAFVAALFAALAVFGIAPGQAQERLRFAHVYEPNEPYHKWAVWAADEVRRKTAGRIDISVFGSSSLGREEDIFAGLALGTIQMTYTGSFYASQRHGPMAVSSAPYMFRDADHWVKYRDSALFREIANGFTAAAGHRVLALTYYGERHVTSNRPIRTPADMRNMKLRVPNSPMYLLLPRAVGANAAPIAFAEVYLALQNGTVDGQENPLPTILNRRFYEVQKYIALTGHMIDSLVTLVGAPVWNRLSAADRATLEETFAEAAAKCTEEIRQIEARLGSEFASVHRVEVLQVDRAAFRAAMAPLLEAPNLPWTPEHFRRVQEIR